MPTKQEVEQAYATVAEAEKAALEAFRDELTGLRDSLVNGQRDEIIGLLPVMPGQPTPAQSLLRGYDSTLTGWVGQLDSQIAQIDLFLQPLNATITGE